MSITILYTLVLVLLSSHSLEVFPDINTSGESEPVADIDIDSDMTYIDLDINRERRTYIDMETATYSDIDSVNNNDTANDDTDNNDTDNNDTKGRNSTATNSRPTQHVKFTGCQGLVLITYLFDLTNITLYSVSLVLPKNIGNKTGHSHQGGGIRLIRLISGFGHNLSD